MYTYGNWTSKEEMPSTTKAFVYLMTDIYNKKYIGVKTLRRQWRTYTSSSKTVNEAISNGMIFTFEILYFFDTKEEAFAKEDELLIETNAVKSNDYYNLSRMGKEFNYSNRTHTKETRYKISKANKGRSMSEEAKQHLSEHKKKFMTDDTKRKMSESRKALMTPEFIKNKMPSRLGTEHSIETKKKISDSKIGKKLDKETRRKMSETRRNMEYSEEYRQHKKDLASGLNNPNFKGGYYIGTIWFMTYKEVKETLKDYVSGWELRKRFNSSDWPEYIIINNRKKGG